MRAGESVTVIPSLGGKARKSALTPERRSEIAKNAALARWANPKPVVRRKKPRNAREVQPEVAA